MSKIAVISSNGQAAKEIIKELVARGNDVTGFARQDENNSVAQHYIKKDLFDLTREDLLDFDVVVDAFGTFAPETLHLHVEVIKHLTSILAGSNTHLLVVGGAGSLYVDENHTTQLFETPDFPAEFHPLAKAQSKALDELRKHDDVNWTFISPAAEFVVDRPKTNAYILGGEEFTTNANGQSIIGYADYAVAMADEVEKGDHIKERICVVEK